MVTHVHQGYNVRLVWGYGGIVTCYIRETNTQRQQRELAQAQPQTQTQNTATPQAHTQAQPPLYKGYYWTPDYSQWFDPQTNQWRSRIEQINGQAYDWLHLIYY